MSVRLQEKKNYCYQIFLRKHNAKLTRNKGILALKGKPVFLENILSNKQRQLNEVENVY